MIRRSDAAEVESLRIAGRELRDWLFWQSGFAAGKGEVGVPVEDALRHLNVAEAAPTSCRAAWLARWVLRWVPCYAEMPSARAAWAEFRAAGMRSWYRRISSEWGAGEGAGVHERILFAMREGVRS